jgi:hypothetical protein
VRRHPHLSPSTPPSIAGFITRMSIGTHLRAHGYRVNETNTMRKR